MGPAVTFLLAMLVAAAVAQASEDEAWLTRATLPRDVVPLLAIVVDTSRAMDGPLDVLPPYDPSRDYTASEPSCRRNGVYWRLGAGPPPGCDSDRWVSLEAATEARGWRCEAGRAALESVGLFIAARAAQWEARRVGGYWRALEAGQDGAVECLADRGNHGAAAGTWYAADGASGPWLRSPVAEPDWQAPPLSNAYLFYTGNYLAYLSSPERVRASRYEWLARRIVESARAAPQLDLALARFSHDGLGGDDDARGGMLALAPTRLPAGANATRALLDTWVPSGPASLAESLVEVVRWLRGAAVGFGMDSHLAPGDAFPSVAGTRSPADPSNYIAPYEHACHPVTVAIATAGRPSADAGAPDAAAGWLAPGSAGCGGDCAEALAAAMASGDLSTALPGNQRAAVRWLLPPDADADLQAAARAGGLHPLELDAPWAIAALVADAVQHDTTVAGGPRLSAAGLESRAFASPDAAVWFALSQPSPGSAWPGNLRRYGLAPPPGSASAAVVVGRDGEPAFDADGRLRTGAWSEWSAEPDGPDPTSGGAASVLPAWSERQLFSDLTDAPLTDPGNQVRPGNPQLTAALLSLGAAEADERVALVEWLLGRDALDEDLDGETGEKRHAIGDAGLRAPRVLRYADGGAALAFLATNDGVLHAFDADTGVERWSFMPAALLAQAAARARAGLRFSRIYGLDGPVELLVRDTNQDGRILPGDGDEAWLFLALGRGGTGYYALDVSDPAAPRLLWRLGAADLPGFARSTAAAVPARMWLDAAIQGNDARVLFLAGGLDPAEDGSTPPAESLGAAMAVVAAASGTVLWRAGSTDDTLADVAVPSLRRSLPAAPRVLDTDGDGLHDRAYVLDFGGKLFRFDFAAPAGGTPGAAVRAIADLGVAAGAAPRRFIATPDAVLERRDGSDVLALAFGSGWVSRPRARGTVDRFYVVFDPLRGLPTHPTPGESDLADATDPEAPPPPDAPGWFYRLASHGDGEKVTGNSLTFDHRLRFTTYLPLPSPAAAPCGPPAGLARLYTLDIRDGRPVNYVDGLPEPDEPLAVEGLAPGLGMSLGAGVATQGCAASACRRDPTLLLGGRAIPLDFDNRPVRTSWRQMDVEPE